MKIKNKYVQIQIGNKTYTKTNMILNKYLNRIFTNQINPSYSTACNITRCFLKLNTPLENISYDSEFSSSDFDIILESNTRSFKIQEKKFNNYSTKTKNGINVKYKFTSDGDFEYYDGSWKYGKQNEFNIFDGKKITAIGFSSDITGILAVLDVSNMNIILNGNEEFVVTRVDEFQSDAICDGFEYPLHLINFGAKYRANDQGYESCVVAQLYSIGLGNKVGLMENEHIIDFSQTNIQDNNITINFNELIKVGHYPSENLQLGFYPTKDNSRYIILKYRLLEIETVTNTKTYLDEYYTMSYRYDLSEYNNQTKNISFNLAIERM